MSEEKSLSTGVVIWFQAKSGFGFIKPDDGGPDLFLHWSNINVDGFKTVKPDQTVTFEVGENHRGPQAENVTVTGELEAPLGE